MKHTNNSTKHIEIRKGDYLWQTFNCSQQQIFRKNHLILMKEGTK